MANIVVVKPSGEYITLSADNKLDLRLIGLAIGAGTVERVQVRYEGRIRDCWLDEEGALKGRQLNPEVKRLAEARYGAPCQDFSGPGAIWIPTPRVKKVKLDPNDPWHAKKLDTTMEDL